MSAAPFPPNEAARIAALHDLDLLDTPPELEFDDITRLASQICETPIALISLIDETRQWFKSNIGLAVNEDPRENAFCAHAILGHDLFVVPDALSDQRFRDNPLVTGEPRIRFYAGAPLVDSAGNGFGTICVIDRSPRELTAAQRDALASLSRVTMRLIEHRVDLRRLEQQRLRSERILQSVEHGLHGMALDGTITFENPAALRMLGFETEVLTGSPAHETMHHHRADGSVYPVESCPIHRTLRDGQTRHVQDEVFWRTDGTSFPVEYTVAPIVDDRGRRTGAIVAFQDVSERNALDRMKSEFVSTVSHELRTPLTSIRGALGLALGGALGEIPAKARSMLEIANRNSDQLTLLINDILDLEKLSSGTVRFDYSDGDLVSIVQHSLEANQAYADRYNVQFELRGLTAAPVNADRHRLAQVMANLLSNAAKYSPPGGTVEVTVAGAESGFRVTVRDQGKGIPDEFRSRIFGRFAQADGSDTREKGGTGLGLSIAKAIVERHAGQIGFESGEGRGTSFYFTIPAVRAGGTVVEVVSVPFESMELCGALRPAEDAGALPLVLHVEDDEDVLRVVAAILEGTAQHQAASTLAAARAALQRQRFDAVILDLHLPDGSGTELLEVIDGRAPVLIFSSYDLDELLGAQVAAALQKTRTSNELLLSTFRRLVVSTREGAVE